MVTVKEIILKYVELRDRKAELAKRQADEIRPISEAMENIENYLMHTMNELGVDQLKDGEAGTVFKSHATSCQLKDPVEFKRFVFQPAVDAILNQLRNTGVDLPDHVSNELFTILSTMTRWDMVDFRAGKKGITEYIANESAQVPGVAINTIATVNIRRA